MWKISVDFILVLTFMLVLSLSYSLGGSSNTYYSTTNNERNEKNQDNTKSQNSWNDRRKIKNRRQNRKQDTKQSNGKRTSRNNNNFGINLANANLPNTQICYLSIITLLLLFSHSTQIFTYPTNFLPISF